jgi:dihydrofolate synthase/folylpolyglutamate synthase
VRSVSLSEIIKDRQAIAGFILSQPPPLSLNPVSIDSILQHFEWSGIKLGLDSSLKLLAALGNPQHQVPIVHVAGSNGKGSVCAYLASVLATAGYRVGRYTSPHLVSWCERIWLNHRAIAAADLEQILLQVTDTITAHSLTPSQFEVITAAAWLYFAQQQVDIAVMEVGLGGRLDATNVCDRPLVSVITSISREHWQILGDTLSAIAGEKAGILKPGCPAVIGQLPPEAAAVINRRIADLGCPAVYPTPARDIGEGWAAYQGIHEVHVDWKTSGVVLHGASQPETVIKYRLPLPGAIQLHNSAVAIAALLVLRQLGWQVPDDAIATGIAQTRWPGRLQWYNWQGRQVLIDGAHNPEGAIALGQFVDQLRQLPTSSLGSEVQPLRSVHWVIGMMAKKDHAEIFQALLRPGDRLYLVPVPDAKSANPEALAGLATELCPTLQDCQTFADASLALSTATLTAATPDVIVLCGSLYLIGAVFAQTGFQM